MDESVPDPSAAARRTFWTAAAFYVLVAFEFFYMASPFAAYFYAAYAPGLRFLIDSPRTAWLSATFLPHVVVETSSTVLNLHNAIGSVLFLAGLVVFGIAAVQVYSAKLRRRGVVTGGLYRLGRHPQYAALSVSGLGLLLLWPRFVALLSFVTMLFAYRLLARAEERECAARFGRSYTQYEARTRLRRAMGWLRRDDRGRTAHGRVRVIVSTLALYGMSAVLAVGLGQAVRSWTVSRLYALYLADSAYVSVARVDAVTLRRIVETVREDAVVRERLAGETSRGARFLNYVVPAQWQVPEIPMSTSGGTPDHASPGNYDRSRWKVVFTVAKLAGGTRAEGRAIVLGAVDRRPALEAVVDLGRGAVVEVAPPPEQPMYAGIPVPLF